MKTTAKDIYKMLMSRYDIQGYKYQVQNAFVYSWECDFFCLSKAGTMIEVEVKTSRSDFKADFKKEKHGAMLFTYNTKHLNGRLMANKFYFAVPKGMVKPEEVPVYAGLIYVSPGCDETVKKATWFTIFLKG